MRQESILVKSYATAKKRCAWASIIIKVDGGFMAFESMDDYKRFKNQK